MEFKFSLSILVSNMGYVFKIFLWVLICMIIVAAIGVSIIMPIGRGLAADTDVEAALDTVKEDVSGFLNGELSIRQFIDAAVADAKSLINSVAADTGGMTALVFTLIFLYLLYSFLIGLAYYPMAAIIDKLMNSNLRFGFAASIALNLKNACRYSAAKLAVAFPVDLLIVLIMAGLAIGLFNLIAIFALPILLAVALVLFTLRATLFSGWLPRLIFHPEEKIFTAFARSLSSVKANIKGVFKAFLITFFLAYSLIAGFALPTFGLMAIVVPSVYYFILRAIEMVSYYKMNGLCFYTDATTVINTVEFGYRSEQQTLGADGENPSAESEPTDGEDPQ